VNDVAEAVTTIVIVLSILVLTVLLAGTPDLLDALIHRVNECR
jgi:hypothetical protein